jgi:hypothetical protein
MARKRKALNPSEPLKHADHPRPVTRRQLISQGFMAGTASVFGGSVFSLFTDPHAAFAALSGDLIPQRGLCGINVLGAGKIPFICFDLAGGGNIAGSNVLVGKQGGQLDPLTTAGYSKLGIPGDMLPQLIDPITNLDHIDTSLGVAFHRNSAMLTGINASISAGTAATTNGAIIPARSDNDTGNNPHNPMYGINRAGANGSLLTLIGSRASDSGGNSMAPALMINPEVRPTKVDRPSDVTGLVDTGQLVALLGQDDAVAVMESIYRISDQKMQRVNAGLGVTQDQVIEDLVKCGYLKSADIADRFGDPSTLNPNLDPAIVGPAGIFSQAEFDSDDEFRKTAAVMKLVVNGFAGAGCVTLGGYDYHTGDRSTGELQDIRAGRCIGACLEYAARANNGSGIPLMIYVFSDGSVSSNGTLDNSIDGGGKGVWTSDNSSTAASAILVYNPGTRPGLFSQDALAPELHQQIGYFRGDGSVETSATPAANAVNLLAETVILNYMALHGEKDLFPMASYFPQHGLGNDALRNSLIAFDPIVPGTIP